LKLPRLPLPPATAYIEALGLRVEPALGGDGLRVLQVVTGSLSDHAGLLADDIILRVGGKQPAANWHEAVLSKKPGEQVPIEIRRSTPTGAVQHTLILVIEKR
jgi:C-terminal processing protease CtpA/Prc